MKNRNDKPDFEAETRFESAPVVAVPFRATQDTELEKLKYRLLRERLVEMTDAELYLPLRRAANDAAGLSWLTSFPLLFFPTLFEEKAAAAIRHYAKQKGLHFSSPRFVEKEAA